MGEMLWLVGFALKIVEDGLRVVAARLWLNVVLDVDVGFEGCFGIGLLVIGGRVEESPLSFLDCQPHVRSWLLGKRTASRNIPGDNNQTFCCFFSYVICNNGRTG